MRVLRTGMLALLLTALLTLCGCSYMLVENSAGRQTLGAAEYAAATAIPAESGENQ